MSSDINCCDRLEHAKQLCFHTGNINSWQELHSKRFPNPGAELQECLRLMFQFWDKNTCTDATMAEDGKLTCRMSKHCVPWNSNGTTINERDELRILLKVFLSSNPKETGVEMGAKVLTALKETLEELKIDAIDSLIVAFPPAQDYEEINYCEKIIKPVWLAISPLIKEGKTQSIGVADMDVKELTALYDWAKVKPMVNHYNIVSCCSVPPELSEFAKEQKIQLLTHNDPPVFLSHSAMREELAASGANVQPDKWQISWIARYTTMIQCRSVISNKAYLVNLSPVTP